MRVRVCVREGGGKPLRFLVGYDLGYAGFMLGAGFREFSGRCRGGLTAFVCNLGGKVWLFTGGKWAVPGGFPWTPPRGAASSRIIF